MLIFGLDIGTTSIGFAAVNLDEGRASGSILRMGVRIFPEARDPDGTPLNQQRRAKRMMRRQLRRRRMRRRDLNELLSDAGLLPPFSDPEWTRAMASDPYALRRRGLTEPLSPYEIGRALYHLAKRRHFRGRELEDDGDERKDKDLEEQETKDRSEALSAKLKAENTTLGAWLAEKPRGERKRGEHANRVDVHNEFERLWDVQAKAHPALLESTLKARVKDSIFAQRPVFWRKKTLGQCPLEPGAELCPRGSWLSQQRRMLEKLNNLAIAGGNGRPLSSEERTAILSKLQTQASMSWSAVRKTLEPLFKARGDSAKAIKFNLEVGGDAKLLGNPLEAKLADILGDDWQDHPRKGEIRRDVPAKVWAADYGEIGTQRVVIRSERERRVRRLALAREFTEDFDISRAQAQKLADLRLPQGWEPYSVDALERILPKLEKGARFGALMNSPEWAAWREATFPNREQPTGEFYDRLPSPADKDEMHRIAQLRNPTVVRTQNELRKVVNNLISAHGKPGLIRIELAREVGKSKREREEIQNGHRGQEKERKKAEADLKSKGITQPSRPDVEKWLLWKESQERCPYSGLQIGFDDLFRNGLFEVEHIWPLPLSLDNSFRNKTLCHRDWNQRKGKRIPYDAFGHTEEWAAIKDRLDKLMKPKGDMPPGKVKRFLADKIPEDFTNRQLTDTSYAARQAVAFLKKLWPDLGPEAPVRVQAVSGRVTAQLRKRWGLNNILSNDGEKTRADHRHHAVDALAVACANPAFVKRLSDYYSAEERGLSPHLPEPWPTIRRDADAAVQAIIVSHRVRKKVSGPLHKETTYGDTGENEKTKSGLYRVFVTRKSVNALSKGELADVRDPQIRNVLKTWVAGHGGDPKKAFVTYPRLVESGPEIRKVRLTSKQQLKLMAPVSTGYADLGANHHVAIYRLANGKTDFEVVSLFEATARLARHEPIVRRNRADGATFIMSLSAGDTIKFSKEPGEQPSFWRVQKIASKGQISLLSLIDASPEEPSLFEPTVGGIMSRNALKLSVDPIGRVHAAND